MKWQCSLLSLALVGATAVAQEAPQKTTAAAPAATGIADVNLSHSGPVVFPTDCAADNQSGGLAGNHNFDNFIGWLSNPLQNIDPRAVTAVYPLYISAWVDPSRALPGGNIQTGGPAITVALSERLAVGMNQGGYAVADFDRGGRGLFRDRFGKLRDRLQFETGQREGWLNTGGFAQYTLIENVPDQFLATAGMRVEIPMGSKALFQGNGPVYLSPYLTVGKEFGDYHVLATSGYEFPADSGSATTNLFYGNIHLDRKIGCFYPLVEFNWSWHTSSVSVDFETRNGFINFGDFESTGNIITVAAGADVVLVKNRLEIGAVYGTPVASQRDFNFNSLLVKMVLRF